jgi:hypothetical protein
MRFFKPSATEYQSQFSPLNLDFMQKNLAQKEANDVVAEDLLDKTSQLQVEGGMVSDPNEVKKYNDWIQTNTANIREKFAAGDMDAKEASRNLAKIVQIYNTNEDIKFFNTDQKLSALTRQRIAEGKANNAISSNISYLNGNLQTEAISSKSGLDALARAHNLTNPSSMYDKENYLEQFRDMKARVSSTSFAGNPSLDFSTGVPLIMNTDGKTVNSQLTREMVREIAAQMAPQEINNAATPWVQYNQNKYKGNYNEANFVDDFENAFTGYVDTYTSDVNKHFSQVSGSGSEKTTTPPPPPRSVAAAGSTQDYGVNLVDMMDSKGIDVLNNFIFDYNKTFDFTKIDVKGTPENDYFTKKQPSSMDAPFSSDSPLASAYQPVDITDPQFKKLFTNFVTNSTKWKHNLAGVNGEFEIPQGTLLPMYGDFARNMVEFKKDVIKTGNTATPITSDTNPQIWSDYVGVDKGAATVGNVITQAINNGAAIYSQKDNRILTPEETTALYDEQSKTPLSGIQEYSPENVLSFMTGDDNFTGGIGFATSKGKYVVNKVTATDTEAMINRLYKNGKLNTNQWLDLGYGGAKYKIDKDNKVYLKSQNNKVLEYPRVAEMLQNIYNTKVEVKSGKK